MYLIWPFHKPCSSSRSLTISLNCGGYILLPISIFQVRALSTPRMTGLTMKDRKKKINSIPAEARTNLLRANGILCHLLPVQEEYSFPVSVLRVLQHQSQLDTQDLTVKAKDLSDNVLWLYLVTAEIICLFGSEVITSNNWYVCVIMMQRVENQHNKFLLSNLCPSLFKERRKSSRKLYEWIEKATIFQDN